LDSAIPTVDDYVERRGLQLSITPNGSGLEKVDAFFNEKILDSVDYLNVDLIYLGPQ